MIRRPRRTTPAVLVAVVLLAVCVLVVLAVVQSLLGQTPLLRFEQLLAVSSGQRWNSPVTIAVAVLLAVLGLILLVAALRPGRPVVMPLAPRTTDDGHRGIDTGVRRRTLAQDLATTASGAPGVTAASVSARRRAVTAKVTTAAADTAAVPAQVRERLKTRLADIAPARTPTVRVRARRDRNT